jgi:hypothetical protein
MEIVNFYPKTFNEIPDQDNPAMLYGQVRNPEGIEDCIMLVKNYTNDHTIILHIGRHGGDHVKHIASVWNHETAKLLADFYGTTA